MLGPREVQDRIEALEAKVAALEKCVGLAKAPAPKKASSK